MQQPQLNLTLQASQETVIITFLEIFCFLTYEFLFKVHIETLVEDLTSIKCIGPNATTLKPIVVVIAQYV